MGKLQLPYIKDLTECYVLDNRQKIENFMKSAVSDSVNHKIFRNAHFPEVEKALIFDNRV